MLPLARPAAFLALGSFLVSGHALLDTHRLLLAPLLGLHVLAVAFWFGALWPLRQVAELEPAPRAAAVLHSFSRRVILHTSSFISSKAPHLIIDSISSLSTGTRRRKSSSD